MWLWLKGQDAGQSDTGVMGAKAHLLLLDGVGLGWAGAVD